ncbi:MAG: hypothetical protein ACOYKE_13905 [Ferruginibacter sp.]
MKKVALFLFIAMVALSVNTMAQGKKTITKKVVSTAYAASRGDADPNIKSSAPTEDKKQDKVRGADACTIYFDNYSGLYVDVYVNGDFMGTMSPYGSLTANGGGYATIYCKSAGGTRVWSDAGNCEGNYRFKLY